MYRLIKFLFTGFWERNHKWEIKDCCVKKYFNTGEPLPYRITYVYTLRCSKCGKMESYNGLKE